MKKILLIAAAFALFSCSSDDTTIVDNQNNNQEQTTPEQEQPVATKLYKVTGTNINQLTIKVKRNGQWLQEPQWVTDRVIPVQKNDNLLITSSGEVTTEDKELYIGYDGDGQKGTASAMMIGQEFVWDIQIYGR